MTVFGAVISKNNSLG